MSTRSIERPVGVATSISYLPELESLRGWAILLVMAFHVDGFMLGPQRQAVMLGTTSPLLAYVRGGNAGVNLFFVLSGFLLSIPFFEAARGGRPILLRRYAARRALRILPLYWAAVTVAGIGFVLTGSSPLIALPYYVFLNSLPYLSVGMMPYSLTWWSLATEVQFYFLLPLLGPALRWRWAAVLLLGAFAGVYGAFLAGWFPPGGKAYVQAVGVSVIGRGPLFLAGIGAAWIYTVRGTRMREYLAGAAWARHGGTDLALLAVLLALGLLLRWALRTGFANVQLPPLQGWQALQGLLWAAVLLLLVLAPLRLKPLFANRVLNQLGLLSYSLYLLHVPIINTRLALLRRAGWIGVGWGFTSTAAAVGLILLTLLASALTYRYIERPFLVRKERFGQRTAADAAGTWPREATR